MHLLVEAHIGLEELRIEAGLLLLLRLLRPRLRRDDESHGLLYLVAEAKTDEH
jgi:threonine/homoserine efflux transporter RhtA